MRAFFDESLLFTAGDDGAVFIMDVRQELKFGIKRDAEKLPFADEVMVTKSDLEEKKSRCCGVQALRTVTGSGSCKLTAHLGAGRYT